MPSDYIESRASTFYPFAADLAEREADAIAARLSPDGAWPVPWSWTEYHAEWAVAKRWWIANRAILNLLYLRALNKTP